VSQLTAVAGIERLDDLLPVLAAKFKGMPTAGYAYRIFNLPDVIIETRRRLTGSDVRDSAVDLNRQQTVDPSGISVSNSQSGSKRPNRRIKCRSAVGGNVIPPHTKVV
jgi:hypothetical protein